MSEQNQKTLDIYDRIAQAYLDSIIKHYQINPHEATIRQRNQEQFLQDNFKSLPANSTILEIGAGSGENSAFLQSLGYNIIASDIAKVFLTSCKNKNLNTIKLNLLTDPLPSNLSGILAWRVFVHFTKDDLKTAFTKIYQALLPDGKFIFNAINRAAHHPNSAWLDFPGEYHLNEKRFFAYYTQSEIAKLLQTIGFTIDKSFNEDGKNQENSWLYFVATKPKLIFQTSSY